MGPPNRNGGVHEGFQEEMTFELNHKEGKRVSQVEEKELARHKTRWKGGLNRVNLGNDSVKA